MTRDEFLSLGWNDTHVSYDMEVGNHNIVAYFTIIPDFPNWLGLVINTEFPVLHSGCGLTTNPCPQDIIDLLKKHTKITKIVAVIDNKIFDLDLNMHINYIDMKVLFDTKPLSIDVSKLPDDTFFYVNNGCWQGYVTTEDGHKVCYVGANLIMPTSSYFSRDIIDNGYELNIDIKNIWTRKNR